MEIAALTREKQTYVVYSKKQGWSEPLSLSNWSTVLVTPLAALYQLARRSLRSAGFFLI